MIRRDPTPYGLLAVKLAALAFILWALLRVQPHVAAVVAALTGGTP